MEWLKDIFDFFIHLDHHMNALIHDFGPWTYLILFLIIFCETGLVVTPFLPGDSLLFAVGAIAALGSLNIVSILILLTVAAILGDTVNYWAGHYLAPKVFSNEKLPFVNKEYLTRTEKFYEKYGNKTIIICRFVPIIRTFAPFLAGVGRMSYPKFLFFNIVGGVLWISSFVLAGYFFGNIPAIKKNFTLVILVIIGVSLIPPVIEYIRATRPKNPS